MTEAAVLAKPELETKALSWPERAKALSIIDQVTYDKATGALKTIKELAQEIQDHHRPVIQTTHAAWKAALAAEKRLLDPLVDAEKAIKLKIGTWTEEQERVRQEEQRRLEEEACKQADEEALAQAEAALNSGASPSEVDAILDDAPAMTMPVVAPPTFQRTAGVTTTERWGAQVVSLRDLARAVADGKQPESLLQPNMVALNGMARSLKRAMNIPGVKAVSSTGVTVR